jgi:hypothetical protein
MTSHCLAVAVRVIAAGADETHYVLIAKLRVCGARLNRAYVADGR